jgi:hypothetical protein
MTGDTTARRKPPTARRNPDARLCVPGAAAAGRRVVLTTGFVDLTGDLNLTKTLSFLRIMAVAKQQPALPPSNHSCRRRRRHRRHRRLLQYLRLAPVDRPPFITAILLTEVLFPQSSTVKHFDPTDLTSTEDTCYVSSVPNYAPGGAVNLALQLSFDAFDPPGGGDGFIEIGLVAVHVK